MESGSATAERMLTEASFRERRRRVLRAMGMVALAFLLGLSVVLAAKTRAPDDFDVAVAFFVVALFGSMLGVWGVARRHWRCPVCDVRWPTQDSLASFQWNHCPTCGEPLRAHPPQREQERRAHAAFALEALAPGELRTRFERRRRRAVWLSAGIAVAGLVVLVAMQGLAPAEWVEHGVVAGFGGAVAATLVWGMRCPRCQSGVVGQGRHCQRCGFRLEADPADQSRSSPKARISS